jgi:hemerythrin superfamily protein
MKTSNQDQDPLHDVSPDDAIGMLMADHRRVSRLFAQFKRLTALGRDGEKAPLVDQICQELSVHTRLEEELFYPAVREATKDDDQMDEAVVEHAGAKQIISQLQGADPGDELYDARVTVLGEQIDHHVEEEEGSIFPKARNSGVDTRKLGAAMLARKSALLGGAAPPLQEEDEPSKGKPRARIPQQSAKPKSKSSSKTRRH